MKSSINKFSRTQLLDLIQSQKKQIELLEFSQSVTKSGGWEYDIEKGKFIWTKELFKIFGLDESSDKELNYDFVKSLIHKDDREIFEKFFENALNHCVSDKIEVKLERINGLKNCIRVIAKVDTFEGKTSRLYGSIVDISEEKDIYNELSESEENYKILLNYLPDGLLIADQSTRCLEANPSLCKMLGYSREEIVGSHANKYINETSLNLIEPALNEILTKKKYTNDFELIRKDRSIFTANINVTVLPDNTLLVLLRDVSDRKDYENKIKRISNDLKRLLSISQNITSNLDVPSLLQTIVNEAVRIKQLDTGAIYLVENDEIRITSVYPSLSIDLPDEFRIAKIKDHPHIEKCINSMHEIIIYDIDNVVLSEKERIIMESRGMKSLIYLPMIINEEPIGVLILASMQQLHKFSKEELEIYRTFSSIASLAINNAFLYSKVLQNENRLKISQEIANSGDFIWEINSGNVTWSEGMYKLLEYDKDEMVDFGKVNEIIHHPDDLEKVNNWLRKAIDEKLESLPPLEYRIIKKSGKVIEVRTVGRIEHRDGKPARILGTVQDVTERNKTIGKMLKAEQEYRTLFESQPIIIWVEDFSKIKTEIDRLKLSGIKDFEKYFDDNRELVKELAGSINILELNSTTVELLEAESKDEIIRRIPFYFDSEKAWEVFKDELVHLAKGNKVYENELPIKTLKGNRKFLHLKLIIHPDHHDDFKKVIVTFQDVTQVHNYIAELKESREQIGAMFSNLDRWLEEERKMIARELHDDLGQVLTSVKMNLSLIINSISSKNYDEDYLTTEIKEIQNIIDMSNKTMRNLIHYLRPEYLDNLGLIIALKHFLDEVQKKNDIKIQFNYNDEQPDIDQTSQNAVFKVIQEAVNNIIKHAKAKNVTVNVIDQYDQLEIEVIDDGIGINLESQNKKMSFGLLGMKERLYSINSDLIIESSSESGTKLRFSIKHF